MCSSAPKVKATPPPVAPPTDAPVLDTTNVDPSGTETKKKGTRSLRITQLPGQAEASSSGLNIAFA